MSLVYRAAALTAAFLLLGTGCTQRSLSGGSDAPSEGASASGSVSSTADAPATDAALPVYFCMSDPGGTVFYALSPDASGGETLSVTLPQATVESGSGMFYGIRRGSDGVWLERSPPDATTSEKLVQNVTDFTIVGDELYYSLADPSGQGSTLYRAGLDGKDASEIPVGVLKQYSDWYIADGLLYYTDAPYGKADQIDQYHSIVACDLKTGEPQPISYKISTSHGLSIRGIWNDKLVYSDLYAGGAGSGFAELSTGEFTPLDSISPKVMIAGDTLYYAGDGKGNDLWRWEAGAPAPEKLLSGQMGHFYQQEDWLYFCLDDSFTGWKRYSLSTGETQTLPDHAVGLPVPYSQPKRQSSALYAY